MKLLHNKNTAIIYVLLLLIIAGGCHQKPEEKNQHKQLETNQTEMPHKVELSGGWARPGKQGRNSACYLSIYNSATVADTILNIETNAAENASLHETFKGENGLFGMRPVSQLVIDPQEKIYLQPGSKHIMLNNLKFNLSPGDSVNITLIFSQAGNQNMRLPVKMNS